jgi:hypothetical protein
MNEQSNQNSSQEPQHGQDNVVALIRKLQEQLVVLERKIDSLINKPQGKSFSGKSFSKPFRSFDRPARHDRGERDSRRGGFDRDDRRSRQGPDEDRPYKKYSGEGRREERSKGKPFYNKYKNKKNY